VAAGVYWGMPLDGEYAPSPSQWVREQVEQYESSSGEEGNTFQDRPVIVVVNRGAKTGRIRKTPLMRVEHDGLYAAIGSKGGAPENPVWVNNLLADPQVELWDQASRSDRVARLVTGEERAAWWERAVAAYPPYADYQKKTEREIPVFVLEPAP
jgi:F420H(2)-dependent quinone reductase